MAVESFEHEIGASSNRRKLERRRPSAVYQLTLALALIAFGAVLFLDNIGLLPIRRIYEYWPLIPIAFGISKLLRRPSIIAALWSIFFIAVGSVFLLVNLHVLHIRNDGTAPLALLLITVGFAALVKTVDNRSAAARQKPLPGFVNWTSTDILNESVVMGSVKRRVESSNFLGGELHNIMGNIEVDLRPTLLPAAAKSATIEVDCVMGGIKIQVPVAWRVAVQAQGILGNVEDKTVAPGVKDENAPVLVITGSSVMGSVELVN